MQRLRQAARRLDNAGMTALAPEWLARMEATRWYAISGDRPDLDLPPTPPGTRFLVDNDPARDPGLNPARAMKERARRAMGREPRAPWHGTMGISAMTEAWNGAVYACRHGASGSMIVFGGGHNDYFGSDVHAFDLSSREWRRISDGYVSGAERDYGEGARYADGAYPDGSPLPPHTYGYVQYDDVGNDYLLLKAQAELGPRVEPVAIPYMFNLDTRRWRRGPRHPEAILNSGGWTTWDPARRSIWGHSGDDGGGNAFIAFAPDGDNGDGTYGRWRDLHPSTVPGIANHNAMQIDPQRDVIVVSLHARNRLHALDPEHPERGIRALASIGPQPVLRPYAALEYSPGLRRLVYFSPDDDGVVYTIAAPDEASPGEKFSGAWTWRAHAPRADTLRPVADAARRSRFSVNPSHAFGRFRVATFGATDVAILVRHVDTPVYAMRLA